VANNSSLQGSRLTEKGYRGARLGEPYIYRWVDQEPTAQTWTDLANKKGCLWVLIGLPCAWFVGFVFGGGALLGFLVLLSAHIVNLLHGVGFAAAPRTDGEPVPKPVRREAYIEYAMGEFYFVLEEDGKARIWQPWEFVRQFEKVDYWSMFGDAGASPYKTGWHAIAMTPLVGRPWMIGSTIEAEAEVRERFTELDARFSADTRARFMRALEARQSSTSRQAVPQTATQTEPNGGVPARPVAKGVPDRL
jgi:hypothetical protein